MPVIDNDQLQMLVYQHATQLSLLDYTFEEAFEIAHRTAAAAFDEEFTRLGLERARAILRQYLKESKVKPAKTISAPVSRIGEGATRGEDDEP